MLLFGVFISFFFLQLFMALLWLIHTIMLILFYRELYKRPEVTHVDGNYCEREPESNSDLAHNSITPRRNRAPSRFFSYVYNG